MWFDFKRVAQLAVGGFALAVVMLILSIISGR